MGLNRPLEQNLQDKILQGEYIDFSLLLPDSLARPQAPDIQLRVDDSIPGSSPVTMVRKRKPVIDSFHKWLDAFTAYALVIVGSHPRRSLELFKYQQIISRAASKFQGTAFLAYDEHFRRQAAKDLRISWDQVDIELWAVTFSGLAKPHCLVCCSPHHSQSSCPNASPPRTAPSASVSTDRPDATRVPALSRTSAAVADPQTIRSSPVVAVSPKLTAAQTDPITRAIAARVKKSSFKRGTLSRRFLPPLTLMFYQRNFLVTRIVILQLI